MSIGAKRLAKGVVISWIRLATLLLCQIAVVPFYLKVWSAERYGYWVYITTTVSVLQTISNSHQSYVGFELMRLGAQPGRAGAAMIRAGLWMAKWLALLQILIGGILAVFVIHFNRSASHTAPQIDELGAAFLVLAVSQIPFSNLGGIWERVAVAYGGFSRTAWWAIAATVIISLAPLSVLMWSQNIFVVACYTSLALFVFNLFSMLDLRSYGRSHLGDAIEPYRRLGLKNLGRSFWLMVKTFLESIRAQGVRLLLAPLAGAAMLAAFTTMRTVANAMLQGLSCLTAPLMPELMRFLAARDQERCEGAFATVWGIVVAFMMPGVAIIQLFGDDIFRLWTSGKISFDPLAFALLAAGVVVYAIAQPAMAVVTGNNLLRAQMLTTLFATSVLLSGLFFWVEGAQLKGAALALLLSEVAALIAYVFYATVWMRSNGLAWPWLTFTCTLASAAGTFVILLTATMGSASLRGPLIIFLFLFQAAGVVLFWRLLPRLIRTKVVELLPASLRRLFRAESLVGLKS